MVFHSTKNYKGQGWARPKPEEPNLGAPPTWVAATHEGVQTQDVGLRTWDS